MKYLFPGILILILVAGSAIFMSTANNKTTPARSTPMNTPAATQEIPATATTSAETGNAIITLQDVAMHNTVSDCWMAVDGTVYDVTAYIASGEHNPEIQKGCGRDASAMYAQVRKHSGREAERLLPQFAIGTLRYVLDSSEE